MLFSDRSVWTIVHGIFLGGGGLLALSAALFALYLMRPGRHDGLSLPDRSRPIALLTGLTAAMLWLATLVGTYLVFPPYRATPPEGATDLASFPRAMILADPSTAWLHRFAMETKEHLPFIASILATAVAFVAWRYGKRLVEDAALRRIGSALLAVAFILVAYISLLGVFVNKVAPLE
jgi:hypothetical protein